jgi:hypothetical protein
VEKNQAGVINMKKIINFLSLKNILLIIASILAMFFTMIGVIHYFMGTLSWGMFIAFLVIITIPFIIADKVPKLSIVSFMIDIHEANQDQDEQREDQEPYFFDTSKLLSFPKKLAALIKS